MLSLITLQHIEPRYSHSYLKEFLVVNLLKAHGGEVRDVQKDEAAGNWISYRYYVVKSG